MFGPSKAIFCRSFTWVLKLDVLAGILVVALSRVQAGSLPCLSWGVSSHTHDEFIVDVLFLTIFNKHNVGSVSHMSSKRCMIDTMPTNASRGDLTGKSGLSCLDCT